MNKFGLFLCQYERNCYQSKTVQENLRDNNFVCIMYSIIPFNWFFLLSVDLVRLIWVTIHLVLFKLALFDVYSLFHKNRKNYHSGTHSQMVKLLIHTVEYLISCEPIFVDGGILAYLLRCNFADASVLIFSRKTKILWLVFLDVNSLVKATHEYNENWATSRPNYSTVYHKHEVYIYILLRFSASEWKTLLLF